MESTVPPTEAQQARSFLDLPIGTRARIYRMVLANSTGKSTWYLNMSSTCRTIRCEAFPILVRERRFVMPSLHNFLRWAKSGTRRHLEWVRHISLNLNLHCSIATIKCVCALHQGPPKFSPYTGSWWETRYRQLYVPSPSNPRDADEFASHHTALRFGFVSAIWIALRSIHNVETLSINFSMRSGTKCLGIPRGCQLEQQIILEELSFACPNILSLTVASKPQPLAYLRRFQKLRHLCFSGYSLSHPEEALSIFRSLKSLDSLSLTADYQLPRTGISPEIYSVARHSLTPVVLAQMNPLKSYKVSLANIGRMEYHSVSLMRALRAHSQSLQNLEIDTEQAPIPSDINIMREILSLASTYRLRDFSLVFKLPTNHQGFDYKRLFPPNGRTVVVFFWTDRRNEPMRLVELKAGKHLLSREAWDARMVHFRQLPGYDVPYQIEYCPGIDHP